MTLVSEGFMTSLEFLFVFVIGILFGGLASLIQASRIGISMAWIQLVMTAVVLVFLLGLLLVMPYKYQAIPPILTVLALPVLFSKKTTVMICSIMLKKSRKHEQEPPVGR